MQARIKQVVVIVLAAIVAFGYIQEARDTVPAESTGSGDGSAVLQEAYRNQQSNVQVEGAGIVTRVLSDDSDGSRHQRFVLKLNTGQTVLVAHNIDLAPRIEDLRTGDTIQFYGEYEWNSSGGVLHWTHRDPNGQHPGGWLKRGSRTYQ